MSLQQRIYFKLPYFAKCWMSQQFAKKENRYRYGPDYDKAVHEIRSRTYWSQDQYDEYQLNRLKKLIVHCATHVPYYRQLFRDIDFAPADLKTLEDIRHIPITKKETMRERSHEFVDERLNPKTLISVYTSGSTGTPLSILRSVREQSLPWAYNTTRHYEWVGLERRKNKFVTIGGSAVCEIKRNKPPYWVYNSKWKQLVMSSFHLSEDTLNDYVDAIRKYKPDAIECYPSSLYPIANRIITDNQDPIPIKAVFTTAEKLWDFQKEAFQKAFCCQTYGQYGSAEQVTFGADCPEGKMHLSPDHSLLEIVDEQGIQVPPGETGHIIGTSLEKFAQPLIRYAIGDLGAMAQNQDSCPCGLNTPVLSHIEGRSDDALILKNGRRMGRLMSVFGDVKGIKEAQIIQESLDEICIKIVGDSSFSSESKAVITQNLQSSIGNDVTITVKQVDEIPRTKAGKTKFIINKVPQEVRQAVLEKNNRAQES